MANGNGNGGGNGGGGKQQQLKDADAPAPAPPPARVRKPDDEDTASLPILGYTVKIVPSKARSVRLKDADAALAAYMAAEGITRSENKPTIAPVTSDADFVNEVELPKPKGK